MSKQLLENLINTNTELKNSYFWSGGDARSRRMIEQKYSVPKFKIEHNGNIYEAKITIACSRKNVYVSRQFYLNGKKTTITPFKTLLAKIN